MRDDILMWSHYANRHTGVCLQFRFETIESFPDLPLPVVYSENYPEYNFTEQYSQVGDDDIERKKMIEFGKTVFLTKSVHWEYEKEWRLIRIALDGQRHTLGELVSARKPRPDIFEAIPRDREFGLEIRPIR